MQILPFLSLPFDASCSVELLSSALWDRVIHSLPYQTIGPLGSPLSALSGSSSLRFQKKIFLRVLILNICDVTI